MNEKTNTIFFFATYTYIEVRTECLSKMVLLFFLSFFVSVDFLNTFRAVMHMIYHD